MPPTLRPGPESLRHHALVKRSMLPSSQVGMLRISQVFEEEFRQRTQLVITRHGHGPTEADSCHGMSVDRRNPALFLPLITQIAGGGFLDSLQPVHAPLEDLLILAGLVRLTMAQESQQCQNRRAGIVFTYEYPKSLDQ